MSIETEADFQAAIEDLVREAYANDVDVLGGWPIQTEEDVPDWDVEIVVLSPE